MADTTRCTVCGAPTRARDVQGVQGLICVSCGAVTLRPQALHQLVTGIVPEPAPLSRRVPASTPMPAPRREMSIATPVAIARTRTGDPVLARMKRELSSERGRARTLRLATLAIGLLTCGAVVLIAIPLSLLVYWSLDPTTGAQAPEPPPAPIEAPHDRAQDLADRGWDLVEGDSAGAMVFFTDSLTIDPKNGDANYGLGYTLERQGDVSHAQPYLCTAMRVGKTKVREDSGQLLATHGLTCP